MASVKWRIRPQLVEFPFRGPLQKPGVFMFLAALLLTIVTATNLILCKFRDHNENFYHSCSHTDHEIIINEASFTLKDCNLTIKGLSPNQYLLCFREGRLIFPSTPQDQIQERAFQVVDGDVFLYKTSDFPPNFHALVYPPEDKEPLQLHDLELKCLFQFKVVDKRRTTLLGTIRSRLSAKTRLISIVIIALFITLFVSALFAWLYKLFPTSAQECRLPGYVARYFMIFRSDDESHPDVFLNLEEKPDCDNLAFNFTRLAPGALDCLAQAYPEVNESNWRLINKDPYPQIVKFTQTCRTF